MHRFALVLALCACNSPPPVPALRLGDLMTQIARRFELLGRAMIARRWELAEFELGELRETFEDVPHAVIPPEVTANIPQLARVFAPAIDKALAPAIARRDLAAGTSAFAIAAQACNSCHQEAGKPFLEIPAKPGEPVPRLDPLP